ncbi:MAG: hypothetical protein RR636_14410, partial [Clostridium sp.]
NFPNVVFPEPDEPKIIIPLAISFTSLMQNFYFYYTKNYSSALIMEYFSNISLLTILYFYL